jgi:hypothetical protein
MMKNHTAELKSPKWTSEPEERYNITGQTQYKKGRRNTNGSAR